MTNNIINSVNNKPLKCIVTNNKNAINYLKNTGDLIVLDETAKHTEIVNSEYREIYLADYFLAGGYGVYNKDQQDTLIDIVNTFQTTIENLQNADEFVENLVNERCNELFDKKLDITYLDEDNNIIYDENNNINPKADASNTFLQFESNNKKYCIRTCDLFKVIAGVPEYKNAEILDVSYNIEYVDYNNAAQVDTNVTTLPINTYINYIETKIRLNLHDCGDIEKIHYEYVVSNVDELQTHPVDVYANSNTIQQLDNNEVLISIKIQYQPRAFVIKEGNNQIFLNFALSIKETPVSKYKEISGITTIDGNAIIYTANMIQAQTLQIDIPSIAGEYYICCYKYDEAIEIQHGQQPLNINNATQSYEKIITYDYQKENPKYTYISGITDKQMIILAVPIKFELKSISIINNDDEIDITNFVNYYQYGRMLSNNNVYNLSVVNKLKCSLYIIYASTKILSGTTLKLEIIKNDIQDITDNTTTNKLIAQNITYLIKNKNINNYWVDFITTDMISSHNNYDIVKNNHLHFITNKNYDKL